MNIRQLETFVAIAQLGSFSAAAARLNASQSTISARIHELEQTLGIPLFDRAQRGVRLTPKGRELLPHAQHAVSAFAEIHRRISAPEALSGLIRIGVAELVAVSWLPQLMSSIRELYPKLSMELNVLLTSEILERLQAGELDMAIIPGSRFDPEFVGRTMGWVRFTWMAGESFRTEKQALTPRDLRKYRIFSLGKNSYHSQTMHEWLDDQESEIMHVDLCNSMSAIASLTAAGLGISLLPESCYNGEIQKGMLRPIITKPEIPLVEFSAVYPRVPPNLAQKCVSELAAEVSTFQKTPVSHAERLADAAAL
jgi:DNA-binding transcriptional LysR family regulator